jgi:ferredoxin
MADQSRKQDDNVDGPYYVDHNCIASKFCVAAAPKNFRMSDAGDHAYVFQQPVSDEEEAHCREAMEGCPVDAVGDDG